MKIYFDNTLIDNTYVVGLHQSSNLFDNGSFSLGSTVCRVVTLQVLKVGVSAHPQTVEIYDDNDIIRFTLSLDQVDEVNKFTYEYSLVDNMVLLNKEYQWLSSSMTMREIRDDICNNYLPVHTVPSIAPYTNMEIGQQDGLTARQLVGMMAEVLGKYAYINASGGLTFASFLTTPTANRINIKECSDLVIGDKYTFDRVVFEQGVNTMKYPDDDHYVGTGDTLYLNPDNIMINSEGMVEYVYDLVNGYSVQNFSTEHTAVPQNVISGDPYIFWEGETWATRTAEYPTLWKVDLDYNGEWLGGTKLEVKNQKQEETNITGQSTMRNYVNISVDRANGEIKQEIGRIEDDVDDLEVYSQSSIDQLADRINQVVSRTDNIEQSYIDENALNNAILGAEHTMQSQIDQTAAAINMTFQDYVRTDDNYWQDLNTNITFNANGINISSNSIDTNMQLGASGAVIQDNNGTIVTSMTATEFTTGEWVMQQTGNVFNIFRREP